MSREVDFLAEVARALIQAARDGAAGGGRDLSERFRALAKGCQALRFKRLYWILDALAIRLAHPDDRLDGPPLEELGRLLADARYTCKALKSHLGRGLEDQRLYEDLIGSGWPVDRVEPLANSTLVVLADAGHRDGTDLFRTVHLLDPRDGALYVFRENRKIEDHRLDKPLTELGAAPLVIEGTVLPSFPPRRLRIVSHTAGSIPEETLRAYATSRIADSVGRLLEDFRTLREEYLAPRTLPILVRPRGLDPRGPGALVDGHGNSLPLLSETISVAEVSRLRHLYRTRPASLLAVFGKLIFVDGAFLFHPWSVLGTEGHPPVSLLGRLETP